VTNTSLIQLRDALRVEFGVIAYELTVQETSSHNQHYIARDSDDALHVTIRSPRRSVDTPPELESVARFEACIRAPTASLVNTNRRSQRGPYLARLDEGSYIAVRSHRGEVCSKTHNVDVLIAAALEHGAAIEQLEPSGFRIGTTVLRYAAPLEAIPVIRQRVSDFVSLHVGPDEARQLRAEVELTATNMSASTLRPRFVHGDLSFQNTILDEQNVQFIDHDCLHFDHPLYDLAHLMLSIACSGYFSGDLQTSVARDFIATARRRNPHISRRGLCDAATYVLLKKTALVRTPTNLRIAERLAILDELRRLT
jgi:hypothetical protein